ncbi:MAG: HigA family addiction module antitoxin [Treponema sp.]|nr:HigA family addiction module antitoxin [Treponema sp.]
MPKTANPQNPGAVLQSFIDKYQINAFFLSKEIRVNYQTVTNILKGKARITVKTALRLAAYFGNSPKYWIDIQVASEIDELSADKKFISVIKSIPKAEVNAGKAKTGKIKTGASAGKVKKGPKAAAAKNAKGKKTGRPAKK